MPYIYSVYHVYHVTFTQQACLSAAHACQSGGSRCTWDSTADSVGVATISEDYGRSTYQDISRYMDHDRSIQLNR